MSDKPNQLYGSMGFNPVAGAFAAKTWAKMRAGHQPYGVIENFRTDSGPKDIMWFASPAARDDFLKVFSGTSVTLNREALNSVNRGDIAKKLERVQ